MSLQKISQIVRDPLAHLSLEAGDAIALFVLGVMLGIIGSAITNSPLFCWGFA